ARFAARLGPDRARRRSGDGSVEPWRPSRGAALHPPEPARLDRVHEHVPLGLLQRDEGFVLADADRVPVDDDLRAVRAGRTERDDGSFQDGSPPFASMWGQTTARRPWVEGQAARMLRTAASMPSRSVAFCSSNARTWAHGAPPARRSVTM